jgi:predicted nucleotidyltransferase
MFERLLKRLARGLNQAGLPYMIIGGQAVLLYGEPRLTKDIDLTVGADLDRLPEVLRLVDTLGLHPLADPQTFTRQTMVLPCQEPESGIRVDIIFSFTPYERQALARTTLVKLGDEEIRFVSLEDLIVHKVIAGRPRDLEDVASVLRKNPAADLAYIRRWLGDFTTALHQPLLDRFNELVGKIIPPCKKP